MARRSGIIFGAFFNGRLFFFESWGLWGAFMRLMFSFSIADRKGVRLSVAMRTSRVFRLSVAQSLINGRIQHSTIKIKATETTDDRRSINHQCRYGDPQTCGAPICLVLSF